jgi:hypothetical protein
MDCKCSKCGSDQKVSFYSLTIRTHLFFPSFYSTLIELEENIHSYCYMDSLHSMVA